MQYNETPIVMDQFDLFGIPTKDQRTYILRKLDPFQLSLLQGTLVYLWITIMTKLEIVKIEGASRQETCNMPLNKNSLYQQNYYS